MKLCKIIFGCHIQTVFRLFERLLTQIERIAEMQKVQPNSSQSDNFVAPAPS